MKNSCINCTTNWCKDYQRAQKLQLSNTDFLKKECYSTLKRAEKVKSL